MIASINTTQLRIIINGKTNRYNSLHAFNRAVFFILWNKYHKEFQLSEKHLEGRD